MVLRPAWGEILAQGLENPQEESRSGLKLRIVLADDNPALLEEVRRLLSGVFEVVSAVANGRELLDRYRDLRPDVVVIDISMPVMDGFEIIAELCRTETPKVVFLTVHEEPAFVAEAKSLGAKGYVLKRSHPTVLVDAIHSAHCGEFFICPELRGRVEEAHTPAPGAEAR